jgi:N-acetylglucosamine-6-sulfatase
MPWLQSQVFDPSGNWLWFPNAVVSTPLCCPSRASILSGRYARHTGVVDNVTGYRLDESDTVAAWLDGAGYETALVGKYLNDYPHDRAPYVPQGWDRFFAKRNPDQALTYYGFPVVDQGVPRGVGTETVDYATDVLTNEALAFLTTVPAGAPWFLYFAPIAPHFPWTPAPRYAHAFDDLRLDPPSARMLNGVRGKPPWIRSLAPVDPTRLAVFQDERVRERRSLLAVDDAARRLLGAVTARGDLQNTVVIFLTDNGYAFGEHRIEGKRCPYEVCIATPLAIRTPWSAAATVPDLIANVDLAPTIAEVAGVSPPAPVDGTSFAGVLRGGDPPTRSGVLIEYGGDDDMPAWVGVRGQDWTYVEWSDGARELYRFGADPEELRNLVGRPSATALEERARQLLGRLTGG